VAYTGFLQPSENTRSREPSASKPASALADGRARTRSIGVVQAGTAQRPHQLGLIQRAHARTPFALAGDYLHR
jgi:hypothetical protein